MTKQIITQTRLKELLYYNKQIGIFVWKLIRPGVKSGSIAGHVGINGYVRIRVDGAEHCAHRLAFLYVEGDLPSIGVDHVNGNPSDNSWANLRQATQAENNKNRKIPKNNASGLMGVSWHKQRGKWRARINTREAEIRLGVFSDFFEAVCARKSAELKHGFHPNHGRRA